MQAIAFTRVCAVIKLWIIWCCIASEFSQSFAEELWAHCLEFVASTFSAWFLCFGWLPEAPVFYYPPLFHCLWCTRRKTPVPKAGRPNGVSIRSTCGAEALVQSQGAWIEEVHTLGERCRCRCTIFFKIFQNVQMLLADAIILNDIIVKVDV